ncbi:MAG: DNA-3-methyladenine glycosylase [Bacteroidetes bacterium]|nr:DNA-3-methyladenine glycosylase [Bacteroidota bacterium]
MNQKLTSSFYFQENVVDLAKNLIGKFLVTNFNGEITSGMIRETEAYAGVTDKASHAYKGKRTKRTEIMYHEGGIAYVYLCYGIHSLFNIVSNRADIPHAILVRAIKPIDGIELMKQRAGKKNIEKNFAIGPGKVSKILGISCQHSGLDLNSDLIWIEDRGLKITSNQIVSTPRIGVAYAGEDALLPYRFVLK